MQEQVRLPELLAHFANNTLFLAGQKYPPPMKIWSGPGLSVMSSQEYAPTKCVETNRCIPHGYRLVHILCSIDQTICALS